MLTALLSDPGDFDLAIDALEKNGKKSPHRKMYINVHGSIVYNINKLSLT